MGGGKAATAARKVMVIADATRESAAALQYTLSHAILENDSLVLLHVVNNHNWKPHFHFFKKPGPNNNNNHNHNNHSSPNHVASTTTEHNGGGNSGGGGVDLNFLEEMKKACKKFQPQIEVTIEIVEMDVKESKDKAHVILSQCSEHGIDLLVIGQRRTLSSAILGRQKRSTPLRGDTSEYLIENSKCTCVAVQKKGQNAGYLLNTKTQRDFWLLA